MTFVVAGVVLILALLCSVVSFLAIPKYEDEATENGNELQVNKNASPATSIANFFSKENWKQWFFAIGISVICAVIAYFAFNTGIKPLNLCRQMVFALVLLSAMILDRKTHQIPNLLILSVLGIGAILLVAEFLLYRETFLTTLIMSVAGLLICVVLFYILARLTREGIGMGDVKLISSMGWMLGLASTLVAVLFGLILCTLAACILLFWKRKNKDDRIPFGPFLFFGYILMLLSFSIQRGGF